MDDYLVVGRIGRPHGIRGEVTLEVRTDEPGRRLADGAVLAVRAAGPQDRQPAAVTIVGTRWHQDRLLVRFVELGDRASAEAARGWELTVPLDPDESPEDPEEFYDHQLVGLLVEDSSGRARGTVTAVQHGAGQDLLHVDVDGRDVLLPFVRALVPEVDVAAGRIVVDDRPGLLDGGAL